MSPDTSPPSLAIDVGAMLRKERERRGLSVEQIANATKIRAAILRAIETNQPAQLPQPIYLRGFLRAYAREVALDPDDVVRRYAQQFDPVPSTAETAGVEPPIDRRERRFVINQWVAIVVLLAVGLVGYRLLRGAAPPATDVARTSPSERAIDGARASTGRPETGTSGSGESKAEDGSEFHVDIRTTGTCWVAATVDGTQMLYQLLQAGEQHSFDVRREVVLRVGDPAAFALSLDGRAAVPLGRPGEAITVRITRDNYREFLSPSSHD